MNCPFCFKDIEGDSTWCRHCGKQLVAKEKWYHSPVALVLGFLLVQPFILPAVWSHPRYSRSTKTIITIIVLILTYLMFQWMWQSLKSIFAVYDQILNGR